MPTLFEPVRLGSLALANRVFMAPLTRNRADADGVPGKLAATYYSQRVSAGLIVSEVLPVVTTDKLPTQQPLREHSSELVTHVMYGCAVEFTRRWRLRRQSTT